MKNTNKATTSNEAKTNAPTETTERSCGVCQLAFLSSSTENVRCPVCRTMTKVRLFPKKDRYVTGLATTVSGRDTVDVADQTATFLRGLSADDAVDLVAEMLDRHDPKIAFTQKLRRHHAGFDGTTAEWLSARYEGKNDGMVRMNVGNVLRGCLKRAAEAN